MNKQKIRVGLIGAGVWGRQHARILSVHEDVEFCAITARTRENAAARAAEYGVRAYFEIDEMLAHEQLDLVAVCLPNQTHFEPTLRVIQAGKSLLVEKPLVFDLHEADILVNEAGKRDLFFAINFNHRYAKPVRLAKQAIDNGRLGEIVFSTWRFGGEGSRDHVFNNLIETQCHGFDMLEHLCGPIESVSAEMTDKTGAGSYTTMAIALRFASGAVGSLVGSYDSSYAYPDTHRVEINGTQGRILIEDTVRKYTFNKTGSEHGEVWQAGYFNDLDREFHRTFDRHMDELLTALQGGAPPPIPASAGQRALQLAHASIESFRTGRRVPCRVNC
jgi:myo-inositol 2-dehydrogenase/D-chiro-inositol 1-dehydrogenase